MKEDVVREIQVENCKSVRETRDEARDQVVLTQAKDAKTYVTPTIKLLKSNEADQGRSKLECLSS